AACSFISTLVCHHCLNCWLTLFPAYPVPNLPSPSILENLAVPEAFKISVISKDHPQSNILLIILLLDSTQVTSFIVYPALKVASSPPPSKLMLWVEFTPVL